MDKKKEKQSAKRVISNNWFLFKICIKAAPLYVITFIFEAIRNQFCIFVEHTYGIGYVLEAAEFNYPFWKVARFLIILFAVLVSSMIFNTFMWQRWKPKGTARILQKLKLELYGKAKEMDLECYDNPKYYNEFVLTIAEAENQVDRMMNFLDRFFGGITTFITTSAFFLLKDGPSIFFVLVSFVSTFIVSQILNQINFKLRLERNPHERKLSYVSRVFYLNDYAKEHRLNPEVSNKLFDGFEASTKEITDIYKKNAKKRFGLSFLRDYICNDFIQNVIYMLYLVYKAAVLRTIPYSTAVILFNSSGRLKRGLRVFTEIYPYASENSLYVEKIRTFLKDEPKIMSTKHRKMPKKPKTFELRNVSFAYSKESGNVITNLNLTIRPYDKIALVGYNGAGKTTLTKLLMRLYDPTEGDIFYDGINIKEYDIQEYRERIGAVFQDYELFGATLTENVGLDVAERIDEKRVKDALAQSGFEERLKTLTKGLKTDITTEFAEDGVNLSGGESQKVAVARVFYNDADFMILDEPSSALDPIAEYQLNHAMMVAANHKTVIFISHRLSTTRLADRIIMLENGKIIEQGTHEDLLIKRGKYYDMWLAQAGQYINVG